MKSVTPHWFLLKLRMLFTNTCESKSVCLINTYLCLRITGIALQEPNLSRQFNFNLVELGIIANRTLGESTVLDKLFPIICIQPFALTPRFGLSVFVFHVWYWFIFRVCYHTGQAISCPNLFPSLGSFLWRMDVSKWWICYKNLRSSGKIVNIEYLIIDKGPWRCQNSLILLLSSWVF